jgi:hypothetical protein
MTDFIAGLEQDLVDAARRRAAAGTSASVSASASRGAGARARSVWPRRPPLRSLLLAAALLVLLAGTAAGGTLLALRGSVIPAPDAVPPEQTPAPGTSRVASIRAPDPQRGLLPWTIRVAQSETGLLCSTVGQVDPSDGAFGLVGLDGRFRAIAEGVSDSCGAVDDGGVSLIGARVFDAARRADVRTVVSGVADRRALARVEVTTTPGGTRRVGVVDGMFVVALRGYPEDRAIRATVVLKNGRREVHDFGHSASVTPDPLGGPAWKLQAYMVSGAGGTCASFTYARIVTRVAPRSPSACGDLGTGRRRSGFFVAARALRPGLRTRIGTPWAGDWRDGPRRTAVWGGVGDDVRSVSVGGRPVALTPSRSFLVVLAPTVDPASIVTRITYENGRAETVTGSAHLVQDARPLRVSGG